MNPPIPLLDVQDFSLQFRTRGGTVHALERVNLRLQKGEIVGLVGESGSGKSVLSYAMLGISDAAARVTGGTAVFRRSISDGVGFAGLFTVAMPVRKRRINSVSCACAAARPATSRWRSAEG